MKVGRFSLGVWLATAFTALSLLLTLSLTAFSDRAASNQVREGIGANLTELAQQTTSRLDRAMFARYREVRLIAQRLGGITDPAAVRGEIEALQKSYPHYAWIGVTDTVGVVRTATRGMLGGRGRLGASLVPQRHRRTAHGRRARCHAARAAAGHARQ